MTKKKTINRNKRWSKADLNWLKANRKNFSYREIAKKLGRTERAIKTATIINGWAEPKPKWRDDEITILKDLYQKLPLEEIIKRINKTRDSILSKAKRIGILRDK